MTGGIAQLRGVRFYDPTTGSFLSRDPLVGMTRDAYGYAGGSPLNFADPSGLYWGEGFVDAASDALPDCFSWQQGCDSIISQATDGDVCSRQFDDGCTESVVPAPDYVTVDVGGYFGEGGGVNITLSRSGHVFIGPEGGVGGGKWGGTVKAGWITDGQCTHSGEDVDRFVSQGAVNTSASAWVADGYNVSDDGRDSFEAGVGSPGASSAYVYDFQWFTMPFEWSW